MMMMNTIYLTLVQLPPLRLLLADHLLAQEAVKHVGHVQVIHDPLPAASQNIFVGFLHCEILLLRYLTYSTSLFCFSLNLTGTDKIERSRVFVCFHIWDSAPREPTWLAAHSWYRPKPRSVLNCHTAAAPFFVGFCPVFSAAAKVSRAKEKGLCHVTSVAGTVMGTL